MPLNIYILRHAESEKNFAKSNSSGHLKNERLQAILNTKDSVLSQVGKRQSQAIADYFNQHDIKIDRIYSSKLTRAVQTAQILNDHLKMSTVTTIEPKLYNVASVPMPELQAILTDFMDECTQKYSSDGNVVYITHNHIIEAFHNLWVDESSSGYKTDNCNLSHIQITDYGQGLISRNVIFWCQEII
jgi:broad specificity phosphatase PhoE